VELEAVSEFLLRLLTGDVDKLPTDTLVHRFWTVFGNEQKQTANYRKCLKTTRLHREVCNRKIRRHCGYRFGESPTERIEQCRRLLAHETNATLIGLAPNIAQKFEAYHSCFRSYRQRVDAHCTEILRKVIVSRRLRATKVVRATMDSMEPLLRALPTLRIIHLVRDPRAVALSRNRFDESGRGLYTEHVRNLSQLSIASAVTLLRNESGVSGPRHDTNLIQNIPESRHVAEASLYCNHVTADIRSRLALEREFPCRIMSIRYEDVVANPEEKFRDIYDFLDEPMPIETLFEMQKKAQKGQAMKISTKWQDNLTYREAATIAQRCAEFFQLMNISATDV